MVMVMVWWWWCPFKMKKGTWPTRQFKNTYRLVPLSTPVSCRWTVPLNVAINWMESSQSKTKFLFCGHCSVVYSTTWTIFSHWNPHCGRLFHIVAHTAEYYSTLNPTPWSIIPCWIPHLGILFHDESYTLKYYSTLNPTPWNIIPWWIPHLGILFHDESHTLEHYSMMNPTPWNMIPWWIPHLGILFHDESHNWEYYSMINPTPWNIIPWWIPHLGIKRKLDYSLLAQLSNHTEWISCTCVFDTISSSSILRALLYTTHSSMVLHLFFMFGKKAKVTAKSLFIDKNVTEFHRVSSSVEAVSHIGLFHLLFIIKSIYLNPKSSCLFKYTLQILLP